MSDASALIDLSHVIEDGMITYKGLPAPIICDFLSREQSREKELRRLQDELAAIKRQNQTAPADAKPVIQTEEVTNHG